MSKTRRKRFLLLAIIMLIATQFACKVAQEIAHELVIRLSPDYGPYEMDEEMQCVSSGREWVYDEKNGEWYCDYSKPPESAPGEVPPSAPEAEETLEPEECSQRASVDIGMAPNENTVCDCAYFVHFTSYEETILYYRTQTYFENEPSQRWQVQRLYAGETWTWSSEKIKDGVCIPAWIDEYTVFIAIEGCDNMAKRAHWAIDEYSRPLSSLCEN